MPRPRSSGGGRWNWSNRGWPRLAEGLERSAGAPLASRVELRASVAPSEDPQKVLAAMRQVLGDCDYTVEEGESSITLSSSSPRCLQKLHDQLRDRHVRDAARRLML